MIENIVGGMTPVAIPMIGNIAGMTPKSYGIYLQTHPGKRAKHKINRKRANRMRRK